MFIGAYFLCSVVHRSSNHSLVDKTTRYIDIYVQGDLMTHNGRHIDA